MKLCTRIEVLGIEGNEITDAKVLDICFVPDDEAEEHFFGPPREVDVGDILHIQGEIL
jgi:hypothetical protein